MKPFTFLFILVLLANTCIYAQFKVKESSEKNKPNWILAPEPGSIISKGAAGTLNEAKNKAIESALGLINDKLINYMLHENKYFKAINLNENSASQISSSSEFYTAIKAGDCDGIYWELLADKKTKTESYDYYMKYSLDSSKLSNLVQQMADAKISSKLDTLQKSLDNIKNIDALIKIRKEILFIKQLLPGENKNKLKIEDLDQQVESTLSKIEIAEMIHVPGRLVVTLLLNNRVLESIVPPNFKSNCAQLVSTDRLIEKWTIDYSYNKCPSSSPMQITVEFDTEFKKISKQFEINPGFEKMEVKIGNSDIIIRGNTLTFYISSMYRKNLILERIIIKYNNLNFTDTPMKQILDGAGFYDISFSLPPGFQNVKIDDKVRGELYYKSAETGQKGIYRFYNCEIKRY